MQNKKIVVIIPALNPDKDLMNYAKELVQNNIDLIIIDDGSKDELKYIFEQVSKLENVTLITHPKNLGKGQALKDGFKYFIENYNTKDITGVVTADSDGQHTIQDIKNIGQRLNEIDNNTLILGTRNFNLDCVPFKSRTGNKITTFIFKLLYGKKIKDTQTGLRGLTKDFAKQCIDLAGDRFEYEISMLITAVRNNVNIIEHEINTVYHNNNNETHFNPVKDSFKIYKVMFAEFFKFIISGLSSAILDVILFTIFYNCLKGYGNTQLVILLSTIFARILSSLYNYIINKKVVFKSSAKGFVLVKYYILCAIQALTSYCLVGFIFNKITLIHPSFIKIVIDTFLFFISFQIQRRWVFKTNEK